MANLTTSSVLAAPASSLEFASIVPLTTARAKVTQFSPPTTDLPPLQPLSPQGMGIETKASFSPVLSLVPALVETEYWYGIEGNDYKNYTGNKKFNAQGHGGDDFIWGSFQDDTIYGQNGNDTLKGWSGNDYLNGGDGDDYVSGESGNDTLDGWYGNDTVLGGDGNDSLYGRSGHDFLDGGSGNDTLYGEADNDTLVGGSGNDTLYGGAGNDRLHPQWGLGANNLPQFDNLYGGAGADTFSFVGSDLAGSGHAVIKDFDYAQGDKIEVYGDANQYQLEYKVVSGIGSSAMDTEIYFLNGNGSRNRIGIVQDKSGFQVLKNLDFNFVVIE